MRAAAGGVQLHGGHAQVEDHAVESPYAMGRKQRGHIAKATVEHGEPGACGSQFVPAGHRRRIAIDGEQAPGAGLQDSSPVAATPERGVEVDTTGAYLQRGKHLA